MASVTWIAGNGASVGGEDSAWGDPNNITAEDGQVASIALTGTIQSLRATDFQGDAIPAGATIDGVTVAIKRNANIPDGEPAVDDFVQLVHDGSRIGANKSEGAAWSTSGLQTDTFGGPSDTWGATLSLAIVADESFGLDIQPTGSDVNAFVDVVRMTINYSEEPDPDPDPDPPTDPEDNSHVLQAARQRSQSLGPEKHLGHAWW